MVVLDKKSQRILLFNRNGQFCQQICSVGQGRNEFTTVYSIDVYGSKVCISDLFSKTIIFDLDSMKFDEEKPYMGMILTYQNDYSFAVHNNLQADNYLSLYSSKCELNRDTFSLVPIAYSSEPFVRFYRNSTHHFYYPPLDNTVFDITEGSVIPYCSFEFGKYPFPSRDYWTEMLSDDDQYLDFMDNDTKYIHAFEPFDNDSYLAVRYSTTGKIFMGFYNKQTHYPFFIAFEHNSRDVLNAIKTTYNGSFVSCMEMNEMRNSSLCKSHPQINSFLQSNASLEDETPILIFWKMR